MTQPLPQKPALRLAVLISGGGTTLRNLIEQVHAGNLAVEISLVISSNSQAAGLDFARRETTSLRILERSGYPTPEAYGEAIFAACRLAKVDLAVMAGFVQYVPIPHDFADRVMNIHPSLIPAFCGQGYYGQRVHRAVLDYGAKVSGCTVHFVDDQYDHGPIILQRTVPVLSEDTPSTLAARVFAEECQAYPEAIRLFAEDRLRIEGRHVRILQTAER